MEQDAFHRLIAFSRKLPLELSITSLENGGQVLLVNSQEGDEAIMVQTGERGLMVSYLSLSPGRVNRHIARCLAKMGWHYEAITRDGFFNLPYFNRQFSIEEVPIIYELMAIVGQRRGHSQYSLRE